MSFYHTRDQLSEIIHRAVINWDEVICYYNNGAWTVIHAPLSFRNDSLPNAFGVSFLTVSKYLPFHHACVFAKVVEFAELLHTYAVLFGNRFQCVSVRNLMI